MGKKRNIIISGEVTEEAPKQEVSSQDVSSNISPIPHISAIKQKKVKKTVVPRGKHYKLALAKIDRTKTYPISEALQVVKEATYSKKNNTIEAHINLGLDLTKAEHKVRTTLNYPYGTGKERKILTIDSNEISKIDEIGSTKLVPGKDFDIVVAHPSVMKDLAKVAKILGPKGIMPNPKSGTVSEKVKETAESLQKGQAEIKTEKGAPVIHTIFGKTSFENNELVKNFESLIAKIKEVRPPKVKGVYIKSIYIKSSMSPSVKIAL